MRNQFRDGRHNALPSSGGVCASHLRRAEAHELNPICPLASWTALLFPHLSWAPNGQLVYGGVAADQLLIFLHYMWTANVVRTKTYEIARPFLGHSKSFVVVYNSRMALDEKGRGEDLSAYCIKSAAQCHWYLPNSNY